MSFNAIVSSYSFNLLFFTQVLTILTSTLKYNEYLTDRGKNISIPCLAKGNKIMWTKEGQNVAFQEGNNLLFINITTNDSGFYSCLVENTNNYSSTIYYIEDHHSNSNSSQKDANIIQIEQITDDDEAKQKSITSNNYQEVLKVKIKVRTVPGPVSRLTVRMSTILCVLIWDYKKNDSGGYPLKSFTIEFRPYVDESSTFEQYQWERLDPINISPNVRYFEIYHLVTNTSYQFRIWPNNYLGAGEVASIIATTLPDIDDDELIRILMRDAKDFDPRIWLYAVSIVMGTMVTLGFTVCLLLIRDCYLDMANDDDDEWDSIEIIPNIILNPGFYETDDPDNPSPPYTRTIIFGEDVLSSSESDSETESMTFKRKLSIFFQGV